MKQFIKKRWPWIVGACILIAAVVLLLVRCGNDPVSGKPTLIVETPQKLSASQTGEFTLDVTISDLGDARYPAMSMSIAFDPSRLEFLGVEEGNIFILSDENSTGQKLPDWSCNVQNSNDTGRINIMFGDTNGDGVVNAQDALNAVDAWLRKGDAPTDDQILTLNVNSDSRINTFDALGIVEKFVDGSDLGVVTKAATITTNP